MLLILSVRISFCAILDLCSRTFSARLFLTPGLRTNLTRGYYMVTLTGLYKVVKTMILPIPGYNLVYKEVQVQSTDDIDSKNVNNVIIGSKVSLAMYPFVQESSQP